MIFNFNLRFSLKSLRLRGFATEAGNTGKTGKREKSDNLVKLINSHEKLPVERGRELNAIRGKELEEYRRKMGETQKLYAEMARGVPTRSEREMGEKQVKRERRLVKWSKYVEGIKKCLNPPIAQLQSDGKIPSSNAGRDAQKAQRGLDNFKKSLKAPTLMKRKYLNYLAQEIVPNLVTRENLEAKILEAVEGATVKSYNLTADAFVKEEESVKERLRQIKVDMRI